MSDEENNEIEMNSLLVSSPAAESSPSTSAKKKTTTNDTKRKKKTTTETVPREVVEDDEEQQTGGAVVESGQRGRRHRGGGGKTSRRRRPPPPPLWRRAATIAGVAVLMLLGTILLVFQLADTNSSKLHHSKKDPGDDTETTAKEGSNCADDPGFSFEEDAPHKNCGWIANQEDSDKSELCDAPYDLLSPVKDACPVACDACFVVPPASPNEEPTLVDGVEDHEVYCEDLTRYENWHATTITKQDGVRYEIVDLLDHDKTSFT